MKQFRKVWVSLGGENKKEFLEAMLPVGVSYQKDKVVQPLFSKTQLEAVQKGLREIDCYAEFDEETNQFVVCDISFEGDHSKEQDLVDEFFQYYPIDVEGDVDGESITLCEFASHWEWEYKGDVVDSEETSPKEFEVNFLLSGNMIVTAKTEDEARTLVNTMIESRISEAEALFRCGLTDDDYTTDVVEL